MPHKVCVLKALCPCQAARRFTQVLLCASSQTSSIVECWSLRKEGLPVNNIFQQISPVGESPSGEGGWGI